MKKTLALFILMTLAGAQTALHAQNTAATTTTETFAFPQWAKDIRRFDIIAFGVFPFAWLFTATGIDLYRSSQHGWSDDRYYPWPATNSKNPVAWNNDEFTMALTYAGIASLSVALIDFIIIQIKRSIALKRARAYTPNAPEIRRTPLNGATPAATPAGPPPTGQEAAAPAAEPAAKEE